MTIPKLDNASALIKAHLIDEAANDFARLSRIPSTTTIRFLDYVTTLADKDRGALLDALARCGGLYFFPPPLMWEALLQVINVGPALVRLREAIMSAPFTMGMRHVDLRMHEAMLSDPVSVQMMAQTRAKLDFRSTRRYARRAGARSSAPQAG
jgi:hypothetical protein